MIGKLGVWAERGSCCNSEGIPETGDYCFCGLVGS